MMTKDRIAIHRLTYLFNWVKIEIYRYVCNFKKTLVYKPPERKSFQCSLLPQLFIKDLSDGFRAFWCRMDTVEKPFRMAGCLFNHIHELQLIFFRHFLNHVSNWFDVFGVNRAFHDIS